MNVSKQKESEAYLQELVLRVSSLYNNWNNISTKNMSKHMTNFMEDAVKKGFDYNMENVIYRAINVLYPLGSSIFRSENNQLSTSLVDAIFIGVMNNIDYYESNSNSILKSRIENLKIDEEFRKYVGSDSSSKTRVSKRLDRAIVLFGNKWGGVQ